MCEVNEDSFACDSFVSDWDETVKKKCVPTQTQVREQLGSKLSDVFFENISSEARVWLGLEPPLVGPNSVWIDPESRIENKVLFTPVPEPAVARLKALTHASVLDVGEKLVAALEKRRRIELEEALRRQAEILEEEWRVNMSNANSLHGLDGSVETKKVVATLLEHFDTCFKDLAETLQLRMKKKCQLKIEEERSDIASYMFNVLQDEIENRDLQLCSEFHDILQSELNILATRYIKQIDNEREIAIYIVQDMVRKYEKKLQKIKMEMELGSIVDVCRAITKERIECNERIKKLREESRLGQSELLTFIEELKEENCTLQKMSTERSKRLAKWRKKVRLLFVEFQKFINFALKAVPGQSEFLLSKEKFMLNKIIEDSVLSPADYYNLKQKNYLGNKSFICSNDEKSDSKEPENSNSGQGVNQNDVSEETIECCQSYQYQDKNECNQNFDYYTFKSMLVRRFASDLIEEKKVKKRPKRIVCHSKKKPKPTSIDTTSELYQMLTLVGDTERKQEISVDCFLKKRLNSVYKICEDDPELAKILLGCLDNYY